MAQNFGNRDDKVKNGKNKNSNDNRNKQKYKNNNKNVCRNKSEIKANKRQTKIK